MDRTNDIPGGRRRYARVPGPFDGLREDAAGRVPVRIVALGIGGCFVKASLDQTIGETFKLHIDLGPEGVVEVSASILYHLPDGSAVTFLNLSQDAFERIRRTTDRQ